MSSLSICALHTRPELTAECARLLSATWPHCKADRLPRLVASESSGRLPCSLALLQHQDGVPDAVIGFVRLLAVTRPQVPPGAHVEALCIQTSKQRMGLGTKFVSMIERYAVETLGCQRVFLHCYRPLREYYAKLSYQELPLRSLETVGGNLLLQVPNVGSWHGNEAPSGWETAYEGRPYATIDDMIVQKCHLMAKVVNGK